MLSLDKQNALRDRYRQLVPGWRPATEQYADLVRQEISRCGPGGRLLDLGCGRGGLIEQLDETQRRQIIGLDPDVQSLQEHRLPWLPRTAGFSDRLPFRPASFDVVFCSWLLEHLETPENDFAAIAQTLRPGGAFVFITPNHRHPLSWINHALGRFRSVQDGLVSRLYGRAADDAFPTRYLANSDDTITHLGHRVGLKLEILLKVPDPTYLAFNDLLFHVMCQVEQWLPETHGLHLVGVLRKRSSLTP